MTKIFSLLRVRVLHVGGAKAQTNGDVDGPRLEDDLITPRQV